MSEGGNVHKDCPYCGDNNYESDGWTATTYTCLECGETVDVQEISKPLMDYGSIGEKLKDYTELAVHLDKQLFIELWKDTKDYLERVQRESTSIEIGVDDDRDPSVSHVDEMSQAEIDERIERADREIGGGIIGYIFGTFVAFGGIALGSLALMIFGLLISLTGIGALLGFPMILMGLIGLVVSPVIGIWVTVSDAFSGDPWDYTGLNGDDEKQDRKWNLAFDAQCAVCGQYFTLRDTTEEETRETATCIECGAVYEKEDTFNWRLIEGESVHLGESKRTGEWNDIAEKSKVLNR